MKKQIIYFLSSFTLLIMLSCNGGDLAPGSTNPAETTIDVRSYMDNSFDGSVCSEFFEGLKEIQVRIAVDRYTGAGTFDQNFNNYRFYVHNDHNGIYEEDYRFVVEVPETGSYAISIDLDGDECYDCCYGNSCNLSGRPSWRGLSAVLNQFPPPPVIYMGSTVEYIDCF